MSAPFYGHSMMGCPKWGLEPGWICRASVALNAGSGTKPMCSHVTMRFADGILQDPTGLFGGKCRWTF